MTEEGRGLIEQLKQKLGLGTGGLRPGENYEDAIVDVVEPFVVGEVGLDKPKTQRLQREKINTYLPKKPPRYLISEQERVVSYKGTVAQLQQSIQRLVDRSPAGTNKKKIRVDGEPAEINYTGVCLLKQNIAGASFEKYYFIQPPKKDEYTQCGLLEVVGVRGNNREGEIELIVREGDVRTVEFLSAGKLDKELKLIMGLQDLRERLIKDTKRLIEEKIDVVEYLRERSVYLREKSAIFDGECYNLEILNRSLGRGDLVLHKNKQGGDHFTMFGRRPERRPEKRRELTREDIYSIIISQEQLDNGEVTLVVPEALLRQS